VVEFEVLDPATVNIPGHVDQLLVLNRAPITPQVFEESDIQGLTPEQLLMVDSSIINNLMRGLLEVLQGSPIERFHHPLWQSDRRSDTTALENLILTRREVDQLCAESFCDGIISLEKYELNLDVHEEEASVDYYSYTRYYEMATLFEWIIYLPGRPRPFDSYTLADTLFFTEYLDGSLVRRHSSASMIREACLSSGRKYGRYLVPAWNKANRVLFRGKGKELQRAAQHTDQGDWESAYDIWEGLSAGEDSTKAAKSFHNMAVYHELEDKIDSAYVLVNLALALDSLEAVKAYAEELEIRQENRKEIVQQIK